MAPMTSKAWSSLMASAPRPPAPTVCCTGPFTPSLSLPPPHNTLMENIMMMVVISDNSKRKKRAKSQAIRGADTHSKFPAQRTFLQGFVFLEERVGGSLGLSAGRAAAGRGGGGNSEE